MIKPFTNNFSEQCLLIDPDKPIRCYRNLNAKHNGKKGCWSVKQGNTVRFHCDLINLGDVKFLVNERLRCKVVAERRKNVHSFVYGYIEKCTTIWDFIEMAEVYYNPYKYSTFVHGDTPIHQADFCRMSKTNSGKLIVRINLSDIPLDIQQSCDRIMETVATHLL